MWIPSFLLKYVPKGKVLITTHNAKNEAYIKRELKKYRLKAYFAESLESAKDLLEHKKMLGVVLDHPFRADPKHNGQDLLKYIRKENETLTTLPVFLVADIETAVLQEYEYLGIKEYFDTTRHRVAEVVREMEPYFIERD